MSLRHLPLGVLSLALAAGCAPASDDGPPPETFTFPDGFVWGAAVAGFQVDMGCPTLPAAECEDPNSDWYAYVTSPLTVNDPATHLSGQPPSVGPGEWELYETDADLLANELGGSGLRFSLEWSRIFPTPTDGVTGYDALKAIASPSALAHYHAMLAALAARGLRPLVTLNHYSLPSWIHDAVGCHQDLAGCSPRGWLDKDRTVAEIAKYAGFCAEEFGAEVDLWATLNEPFAVALPGYLFPTADRSNPPAVALEFAAVKTVILGLIEGHARMYDAVKANDAVDADGDGEVSQVGVVFPMAPVAPLDPSWPTDVAGAENVFYLYNLVYLNAVVRGELDAELDGTSVFRDDLANRMDYLGINYYTRVTVQGTLEPFFPELSPLSTFNALTMKQWEDYPRGLYEMAMLVKSWGKPMYITENGAADPSDDGTASSYLVRHLAWLARAIRDGADVRGYFYWSLMDNYEWNHGMDVRMGLYAVDKDDADKTRTARQTVATYRAITDAGAVPAELAAAYPAP